MSDTQPENLPATSAAGDAQTPAAEVVDQREGMFGVRGTGDTSGFGGLRRQVALPGGTPKPYGWLVRRRDRAGSRAWPATARSRRSWSTAAS